MSSNPVRSLVSVASALLAVACGDAIESGRVLSTRGPAGDDPAEPVQSADAGAPATPAEPTSVGERMAATRAPDASAEATALAARNRHPDTRDVAALGAGNRAFAFDLFKQVARTRPGKNIVLSPYGVSSSLATVFAGARRRTEAEMGATLRFPVPQPAVHDAFNAVALQLAARGEGQLGADRAAFRLNVDNALWVQDGWEIEQAFLDTLAKSYGAAPHAVDFIGDSEAARSDINAWLAERTGKRVPELLPRGTVGASTSLLLTSTVSFDASWKSPFDPGKTAPARFTKLAGDTVSVATMHTAQLLPYARGESYEAIALPYASPELSLIAVLPDAGEYAAVESGLGAAWFDQLRAELNPTQLSLAFPKIDERARLSLKEQLVALDMRSAFSGADFSGITPEGAAIDDVLHEAVLKVLEGGTMAAAATAVSLGRSAGARPQKQVRFDRPFFYAIVDAPTGQILFLGRVLEPQG